MRSTLKIMLAAACSAAALTAAGAQTKPATKTAKTAPAQTAPADTAVTAQTMPAQSDAAAPTQAAPTPAAPGTASTAATSNPTVGGAAMDATKPIPVNASAAPNLTTLVAAVKAAGLVDTLAGPGPFTVFAPTNEAFTRLAPGTVDTLLKPANKPTLVKVLTYHVVPGTVTLADLQAKMKAGGGKATLTTVEGAALSVEAVGDAVVLTDVNGNKSYIETPDVKQSNGVVHVVNGVLLPKL